MGSTARTRPGPEGGAAGPRGGSKVSASLGAPVGPSLRVASDPVDGVQDKDYSPRPAVLKMLPSPYRLSKRLRRTAGTLLFERRRGVETADAVQLADLGLIGEDRTHYEPAEWHALGRVLRARDVGGDDVFLDFGSGKGRVVLQAAGYPFKRVLGVELSEELTEVARANLASNADRLKCRDVRLESADALEYDFPDDVTVVFFNNPFTGELFGRVVAKILASVDRRPRRLRVIYRNPVEEDQLLATGRFRQVRHWRRGTWRGRPRGVTIRMYELLPPAAGA